MSSMHMPWYARVVSVAGRPFVLVAALVMSVPGEIRMAQIAGWHGWVTWLMPVSVSVYAGCAAVISETRRRAKASGRTTATIGAGAALGLALAAQVMAHLIDQGYMTTSAPLVAAVSSVPPLVVAHMLHMAATPTATMTAEERMRELQEALTEALAHLDEAIHREARALIDEAYDVRGGYEELAEDAVELAGELTGELAAAGMAEPKPQRQGRARKAVPLAVVKEAVAAMEREGEKVNGPSLAARLGCSIRSGYRYLGDLQAA
ncbi:hypothetical protein AB0D63_20915 [Kitasatospora sp. NPDC048343]|uniref:hypothetical protein n=1 Tax=Kitasatospora sp. NPDC048343 TaxID=3154717 RepID=UPI0033CE3283